MRVILVLFQLFFLLYTSVSSAQGGVNTGPTNFIQSAMFSPVAPKPHPDINGSPFLLEDWLLARIQMPDNSVVDSIYVKLNLYDEKLQFKNEKGEELESSVRVKQITIIDINPKWKNAIFRTGYAGDPNAFHQVLADGSKMQVLKKLRMNVTESTQIGEGRKRNFQYNDELFFAIGGTLYKSDKKCSALQPGDVFGADKDKVQKFISDNNIRCNQSEDMKKLANYYNSL